MKLGKYSFGVGDRFGHQARAQLEAFILAKNHGVTITPVWNKSFREHQLIGSKPDDVRKAADRAVRALGWKDSYFVDADHIGMKNIDFFLDSSDFFTIDVADFIGQPVDAKKQALFVEQHRRYLGSIEIPGIAEPLIITRERIESIASKYLAAIEAAGKIYAYIFSKKDGDNWVVEVSMDETSSPQTPVELLFILAGLANREIPVATIAPKFSGRFNKGIDYIGDLDRFAIEFAQHLAVIRFAIDEFSLPRDLKLSVHSGSDKFSIYPLIRNALVQFDAGVHLKTAGTTWLEELIGLAEAGGEGLALAKGIYRSAWERFEELCAPYAAVVDIDRGKLPQPFEVDRWDEERFATTLRHHVDHPNYNPHFRQLLHVAYKIAAELGDRYLEALDRYEAEITRNVTTNIFERHIKPIFLAQD